MGPFFPMQVQYWSTRWPKNMLKILLHRSSSSSQQRSHTCQRRMYELRSLKSGTARISPMKIRIWRICTHKMSLHTSAFGWGTDKGPPDFSLHFVTFIRGFLKAHQPRTIWSRDGNTDSSRTGHAVTPPPSNWSSSREEGRGTHAWHSKTLSGEPGKQETKKQKERRAKINEIVSDYSNRPILTYLGNFSYSLGLAVWSPFQITFTVRCQTYTRLPSFPQSTIIGHIENTIPEMLDKLSCSVWNSECWVKPFDNTFCWHLVALFHASSNYLLSSIRKWYCSLPLICTVTVSTSPPNPIWKKEWSKLR